MIELNGRSYKWRGSKSEWDDSIIVIMIALDVSSIISYKRAKAEVKKPFYLGLSHMRSELLQVR